MWIYDLEADALRLARHVSGFYDANGLLIHRFLLQSLIQNGMAGETFGPPGVRRECLLALAAACLAKLRPYYRFRLQPLIGRAFGRIGALQPGDSAAAISIEAYLKAAGAAGPVAMPQQGIALRLARNLIADRDAAGEHLETGQMRAIADLLGAAADGWARLLVRRTRLCAGRLPVSAIRPSGDSFARAPVSLAPPGPRTPDSPR